MIKEQGDDRQHVLRRQPSGPWHADQVESVQEWAAARPSPALGAYMAGYHGYRQAGLPPARHAGLPSPYLTLILTLHEPLVIAGQADPRHAPGPYDALVGGLSTSPT